MYHSSTHSISPVYSLELRGASRVIECRRVLINPLQQTGVLASTLLTVRGDRSVFIIDP